MELHQAVVFGILMQNNDGIKTKAPQYVLEKLKMCEMMDQPQQLLDASNKRIFDDWVQLWSSHSQIDE